MMVYAGILEQVQRVLLLFNGIEIPEHGSGSELFSSLLNKNKHRIDENENKINDRTMNK
jgi:hypothetical protein